MGNPLQTIPSLPPAIGLDGSEQFWLNQAGVDRRATLSQMNAAGPAGSSGLGVVFDTVAQLQAATVGSMVEVVTLSGYYAPGDYGGASYVRAAAGLGIGKLQSADGAWWSIFSQFPTPRMFGAVGSGNDDTAAVQACIAYADTTPQRTAWLLGGPFTCTADLLVPLGTPQIGGVDIRGPGRDVVGLVFTGAGVLHGLYSNGVNYQWAGVIADLWINCAAGAVCGLYDSLLSHPIRRNIVVTGARSQGVVSINNNFPDYQGMQVGGCGGDTISGQVEFDLCTISTWDGYIFGGAVGCQAGLKIDRSAGGRWSGAIESCGIPIMVASKPEATTACRQIVLQNLNLENPTDHYIELGYGWTGTNGAAVLGAVIRDFACYPSGSTSVLYGIKARNTFGLKVEGTFTLAFLASPAPVCNFWFEGATNFGWVIDVQPQLFGFSWPWVMVNGFQAAWAAPYVRSGALEVMPISGQSLTLTPNLATPTAILAPQGGIAKSIQTFNNVATTYQALIGAQGNKGMEIWITCGDNFTTINHTPVEATNTFFLKGQANLLLVRGAAYNFISDGTAWRQS